ncbi:MAG: circularly permuted type 2 ATP-grasp protein [Giesbergeria sp.]|uniref:circularly permuted type 2 ATP-grasp protein n=1 Tax=Giesbergeria sp. TaxID=2818473 RepID=UPI0026246B9B|nr:circularly permuted type 2 ATP-grasp protein [Giesbergeria sp.]MDD2610081.1 circularly permuted type 2 ATP-grasp protein [Giesbergeria sp.]
MAAPALPGHYDELRGCTAQADDDNTGGMAPAWRQFFAHPGTQNLADLNRRQASLEQQIRDNGISYNVYADSSNPQRPWSLDLFPLIVQADEWRQIEAGVLQRVRLLERTLHDVYGAQELLRDGLLPAALVQGHPGYLRTLHGMPPVGGNRLQVCAFDLARGPDGRWAVAAQRTQAPSGLGYALENRLSISRLFPQAFESLQVQRLASSYRALINGLRSMSPAGADAHIALLTPGPYNETYFEQAYLTRYLGITLVQGNDLTVRDNRLFLRTLRGLEPVHVLIKRVDDAWCDPLELRADSSLGVPGLLQTLRSGNLLMSNMPGSAFLESVGMLGFMPELSRRLLGQELLLPSWPTWWCGEHAALQAATKHLSKCAIKPTYTGSALHSPFAGLQCSSLEAQEQAAWLERLHQSGEEFTLQQEIPLSQMPTWDAQSQPPRIVPREVMLRVFALTDGQQSWRVLPGGLGRIVSSQDSVLSLQRGGSSADVWVRVDAERGHTVDRTTLLNKRITPTTVAHYRRVVTSRAAENLFWLGRYTERSENSLRLARLTLSTLGSAGQSCLPLVKWLGSLAASCSLVPADVPSPMLARRVFTRALVAGLGQPDSTASVGFNLRSLRQVASSIRERLSQEHWGLILRTEQHFMERCAELLASDYATLDVLRVLDSVSLNLAAMTGDQTDRMTRDDGWRLLSIGRQLERLDFLSTALARALEAGVLAESAGFEAVLALFDSSITFHAQYQRSRDVAALLELLVISRENPRSLGWVVQTLRGRLAKLAADADDSLLALTPDPNQWNLAQLCDEEAPLPALAPLLERCTSATWRVSDGISLRYFTHTHESSRSLGA